jgi:hypothetical protein
LLFYTQYAIIQSLASASATPAKLQVQPQQFCLVANNKEVVMDWIYLFKVAFVFALAWKLLFVIFFSAANVFPDALYDESSAQVSHSIEKIL